MSRENTNYFDYRITEIFGPSIQGEGALSGYPTIFIRFAGCSLACPFCDTPYPVRERLNINAILNKVKCLAPPESAIVTLTGGEPFEQTITPLCRVLYEHGYRITAETNGTVNQPQAYQYLWNVTVSPKRERKKCRVSWKNVDTIKCLWPSTLVDPADFKDLPDTIDKFIQPVSQNYDVAIQKVKEMGFPWRLSVQVQKIIGELPPPLPVTDLVITSKWKPRD